MADDLPDQRLGASIVVLGAALLWRQTGCAVGKELLAELEVALPAEAEFFGGRFGAEFAFAFEQHGQAQADGVIVRKGKRAERALKGALLG